VLQYRVDLHKQIMLSKLRFGVSGRLQKEQVMVVESGKAAGVVASSFLSPLSCFSCDVSVGYCTPRMILIVVYIHTCITLCLTPSPLHINVPSKPTIATSSLPLLHFLPNQHTTHEHVASLPLSSRYMYYPFQATSNITCMDFY